jgi:hypothetical protein
MPEVVLFVVLLICCYVIKKNDVFLTNKVFKFLWYLRIMQL